MRVGIIREEHYANEALCEVDIMRTEALYEMSIMRMEHYAKLTLCEQKRTGLQYHPLVSTFPSL